MVTLRLTHKLKKALHVELAEQLEPTTSKLGDWYANLAPTFAGDLIVMVNERTLLSVAIPMQESDRLLFWFPLRLANLLGMIGIQPGAIKNEAGQYHHVQFGKTKSRSVLGSLNDIAYQYQALADWGEGEPELSLSKAEYQLSEMPCKPIGYRIPSQVAKELLEA